MVDFLKTLDLRWAFLFASQIAVGLYLMQAQENELGKLLLASAFGQAVTGGIKTTKPAA